MNDIDKEK
jgi:hypothetical protein